MKTETTREEAKVCGEVADTMGYTIATVALLGAVCLVVSGQWYAALLIVSGMASLAIISQG